MRIRTAERGAVQLLEIEGALSIGTSVEAFDAACKELIGKGGGIVLDLTRTAYVDSSGLAAIVACAKRAAERGAAVKLVLPGEGAVPRVFAITQLDRIFEVFADADAAVASFS